MKYSSGLKASVVKRVLPPENQSIREVSQETGIGASTIRYWKKQAETGSLEIGERQLRPSDRSSAEKLTLLLESRSVSKEERGQWLRARGLHSEHLPLWEQELREVVTEREKKQRKEITDLKSRNRELEKELNRKEKALAETAALLALKKKANAIWGEDEDD